MRGAEAIENADVLVVDGRIAGVGSTGTVRVPPQATVRDVTGCFIVPGFVNTHAHFTDLRRGVLDLDDWGLAMSLAYGVTTALDPYSSIDTFVYGDLIDAGRVTGPRLYTTGRAIHSSNRFGSQHELKAVLQQYRDHYRTRNLKYYWYWSGDRRQRQWFVDAAGELGMLPTAEGVEPALTLSMAMDGFFASEHRVPTQIHRDVVQLFAQSGTGYTPANMAEPRNRSVFILAQNPYDDPKVRRFMPADKLEDLTLRQPLYDRRTSVFPIVSQGAAQIFRAGGRVGAGDHGEFEGLGYHWELEMLAAGGLTPHEVLQIATRSSSEVIGRDAEMGTLEAGKHADLLVLRADPRADIRNARVIGYVMKNGRLYDAQTLDEVWPQRRTFTAAGSSPPSLSP